MQSISEHEVTKQEIDSPPKDYHKTPLPTEPSVYNLPEPELTQDSVAKQESVFEPESPRPIYNSSMEGFEHKFVYPWNREPSPQRQDSPPRADSPKSKPVEAVRSVICNVVMTKRLTKRPKHKKLIASGGGMKPKTADTNNRD